MNKTKLDLIEDNKFCITGELTFNTVNQVWEDSQILFKKNTHIDIDLANVTRSDSAALALLIEWFRYADRYGKSIVFTNVPIQLVNIAKISGIDSILKIDLLHDM